MTKSLRGMAVAGLALLMLASHIRHAHAADAARFDLITAAEAQQEAKAEAEAPAAPVRSRGLPVVKPPAPSIRVVAPSAPEGAVAAPLRIELAFKAAPGTRIVPSTFRVLYGLLKIDLTERLKKHAKVNENGVVVEGAQVPDGPHRLIVQVADDQGNMGEQELLFRVGGGS